MPNREPVQNVPSTPVFIYDGECRFCRRWVEAWQRMTEGRVVFQTSQGHEDQFLEISPADYATSSQFIETDGRVYSGAEAVFRMMRYAHGKSAWFWAYEHIRGFEPISECVYRAVARNRAGISRLTLPLTGTTAPSYRRTRSLFLRLLGLVYLCAFASFWSQATGLIGSHGILPVGNLIESAGQQLTGFARWQQLPTFCWVSSSDGSLLFQCAAGTVLSVSLIAGFLPALVLPLLWLLWLSLTIAGQTFMAFQWESLLLETGFLAIFLAPVGWTVDRGERPSGLVLFLFRWLIFRLMFLSGIVKLLSGDPAWRNFTALSYHFETQPLPTILGWYAHQMPGWFLTCQTAVMYAIELGLPFLVFGGRKLRLIAFAGFTLLQTAIALTGNYGYFNLLSLVLCVLLLDDRTLRAGEDRLIQPLRAWRNGLLNARSLVFGVAALGIVLLSVMELLFATGLKQNWSTPLKALYATAAPFRSVNSYGLFAVMTRERPEIIVQGSNDGVKWMDYSFKYKPGDLKRAPGFVAPHQPRLDWQMWFAALGSYQQNPWFTQFCLRLLQGAPEVLDLLAENPFPKHPPRFIRAMVYDYEFSTPDFRSKTGQWWTRKSERIYLPQVSLGPVSGSEPSGSRLPAPTL